MTKNHHNTSTALVYARSLLELATERNQAEPIGEQLKSLADAIENDPALRLFVIDPSISIEQRAGIIKKFDGKIDPLLVNFLGVLNAKGRLGHLGDISQAYQDLLDELFGKIEVDVITAQALSPEEVQAVRAKVSSALGKTAVVHQYVDPAIIGGLVLRVQDQLIDASVKYQLQAIREQLLAKVPK